MRMKSEVFSVFCSIVVMVTLLKANAEPGGWILLRLNSLENKNYASGCCSGCAAQCNYQLEIWATCDIGKKNNSDCPYGYSKTGIFSSTFSIIFGQSLGNGLRNPLAYNFTLFRGTLGFQILVRNQSGRQIDEYTYHVGFYPGSNASIKWESVNLTATGPSDSRLNLAYSGFCNEHYYGPSCVVGCIPGKTYVCDKATGRKICIGGWLGPECNCKLTSKNTCDIGTGKKFCYLPWYGENCDVKCEAKNDSLSGYTCNKTTGAKTCLDGWYGNECSLRTPLVQGVSSSSPPGQNSMTIAAIMKTWQRTKPSHTSPQLSFPPHHHITTHHHTSPQLSFPPHHHTITHHHTSPQLSTVFHQTSKQPYSSFINHSSTTESTPQSCLSSLCFVMSSVVTSSVAMSSVATSSVVTSSVVTSSVVTSSVATSSVVTSLQPTRLVVETILLSLPKVFTDVLSPTPTLGEASSKGRIGTSVNNEEHTVRPEVLPETTKPIIIEPHPTSWKSSREGPIGTSVNNEEHTVRPEVLPETTKPIIIEPHPTSWKSSREGPIGTSVNIEEHTVKSKVLLETIEPGIIEPNPSLSHSVPETSSVGDTKEIEPGSREARKKQDVWWMVLLPFALVALLVAAGVVILKKRGRKRAEISPMAHHEIPLEETQVQEDSNTNDNQVEDHLTPFGEKSDDLTKVQSGHSSAIFYT